MSYMDDQIKEAKIDQGIFEDEMFAHLKVNPKGCGDMKCLYCGTWADHLREEEDAWRCDPDR